jgi:TetR/AcrR family transcriptional repressor of lmrAB and yxaGH operons
MARRTDTRARVLRTAAGLFRRQGYNATGLNQVLADSSAPKGSLYFHFPGGKEQLAAESVALSGEELGRRMAEVVTAASGPAEAITALGELFAQSLTASGFRDGCPVATVALEAAVDSEPIRAVCDGVYAAWQSGLASALRRWDVPDTQADSLAAVVLSALQGALLLARVQRSTDVIHEVTRQIGALAEQSRRIP